LLQSLYLVTCIEILLTNYSLYVLRIRGVNSCQSPSCRKGFNIVVDTGGLHITGGRIEEVDELCDLRNLLDYEAGVIRTVGAGVASCIH